MSRYLDPWFDPMREVDPSMTSASVTAREVERLRGQVATLLFCKDMKRRLGGNATRDDLASDKQTCKRMLHVAKQSLVAWGGELPGPASPTERKAGATIDWTVYVADTVAHLEARRIEVATWGKKAGEPQAAKLMCVKLTNEIEWLRFAAR